MTDDAAVGELPDEAVLASYEVLARFPTIAGTEQEAVATLRSRLEPERGQYDDVTVERREPDGTWMVLARFVVATVDAEAAVAGVHAELTGAGLTPDEVWAGAQY